MVIKLAPETFAFPEVAAPGTPDTGYVYIYAKSDGAMYMKDDTGTETPLGGGTTNLVADTFTLNDGGELTLDTNGAITVTHTWHTVDTFADAADDSLITVNGLGIGEFCFISLANASRHVTVEHDTDNIFCPNGTDITSLNDARAIVLLIGDRDGTNVLAYPVGESTFQVQGDAGSIIEIDTGDLLNIVGSTGISTTTAGLPFGLKISVTSDVTRNAAVQTLTNKTIDADDNTLLNLPISTVVSANKIHKFGANQSTTSGTMTDVDATNAAITATLTGAGDCKVQFSFRALKATAGSGFFRITDGTNSSDEVEIIQAATPEAMNLHWIFDTSAGSTTYKLQFRTSDANAVLVQAGMAMNMTLEEIA